MAIASHIRYRNKIRSILLSQGKKGITQHTLNQKTRTKIFKNDDLLDILEAWEAKNWVQQFKNTEFTKRPRTIWRATVYLRDQWSNLSFTDDLPED